MEPVTSNPKIIGVEFGESSESLDSLTLMNFGKYCSLAFDTWKIVLALDELVIPLDCFNLVQSDAR